MYSYAIFLLFFQYLVVASSKEGDDRCYLVTGGEGKCVNLQQCPYAMNLIKLGKHPQNCGFIKSGSLVCCKGKPQKLVRKPGELSSKKCQKYYPFPGFGIFRPGGNKSLAKEFPHMAAIGFGDVNHIEWRCGGSLISMDYILTASCES